tara:strand:+ start:2533 stop:2883 length:351 start_codon:yes stop_codon:yes gene_type:complete
MGVGDNELPYVTIDELSEDYSNKPGKRFRIGGIVYQGSVIVDEKDPLLTNFILEQEKKFMKVSYHQILPDMFKDGSEVIVEGIFDGEVFFADNLMTKCASKYEGDLRDAAQGSEKI